MALLNQSSPSALVISLLDVYAVSTDADNDTVFRVHAIVSLSKKKHEEREFKFRCDSSAEGFDCRFNEILRSPLFLILYLKT